MSKAGLGALVAVLCGLTALAQEPRDPTMAPATMEGMSRVSSTVMATVRLNGAPGSPNYTVTYVILWRGEPGWMGNGSSQAVLGSSGTIKHTVGSHVLEVTLDGTQTSATVARTTIDLRKANVIFVDRADHPSAAHVIDTQFVDVQPPRTLRSPELTRTILRSLPTLPGFAGCEAAPAGTRGGGFCAPVNTSPR